MRLNKSVLASMLAASTLLAGPADAQMSVPGGGISEAIGGVFGGGDATLELQLLQQAELLNQVANQLTQIEQGMAMLEQFTINNSADVFAVGGALQGVLHQANNLIARHGQITGYIDDLYPEEFDINTPAAAFVDLARQQHIDGRQRQIDAANIQAELFAAMEEARIRDRNLMDESAAAPGVTSAVQATNQLLGGLGSDVRGLQMAAIAHQRTVEDRFLKEDAGAAEARAKKCKSLERMPESRQPEYCK